MSTRSQILFKFKDGQVLTYRHSDGYPEGVIPDLVDFLKWNKGRNNQPDYVIPNYFYWSKKESEQYVDAWSKTKSKLPIHKRKLGGNESVLIGYGLDYNGELHDDIEWFYVVEFFDNNPDSFHPEMSFRIKCYKIPYDTEYEYPEQIIKNELPKHNILIQDLEKFEISTEDIKAVSQ